MTDVPADLLEPEPGQGATGEPPPGVTEADAPALEELATAGWGEGDGDDAELPRRLLGTDLRTQTRDR